MTRLLLAALACLVLVAVPACERIEVDPAVAERPLPAPGDPLDTTLAEAGELLFRRKCAACHTLDGRAVVGPSLDDVAARRSYPWIRAMVLAPDSMLRVDEDARALLEVYGVPMVDTGLDEPHFRAVLEYLRMKASDAAAPGP